MSWLVSALVGGFALAAAAGAASTEGPGIGLDHPRMYTSPKRGFLIAKPEPWFLLTQPEDLERECVGLMIEDSDELTWDEGLAAITNVTPLEPSGLLAVPFSPRVEVDVYRIAADVPDDRVVSRVVDELIRGLQEIPDMYAQVVVPPNDVDLNGKTWRTVELSTKMRLPMAGESGTEDIHTRVEVYVHAEQRKLFLVQYVARTFDVPTYRPAVRQIVGSITLAKPSKSQARKGASRAGAVAEPTASQPSKSRNWLWGWWRHE